MLLLSNDTFSRNRILVMLVVAGVLVASWVYAPYVDRGPVICVLHGVAGLPCPSCGLTRAFCDLVHGRLASAVAHNAVALPLFLLFLAALPTSIVELIFRRRLNFYCFMYSTRIAYVLGGTLTLYHVGRTVAWFFSGRLFSDYVANAWTYKLWQHFFG